MGRTTSCPCCYGSDLYPSHARTPTAAITSVLGSLLVNCNRGCNRTVQTKHYKTHCSSQCTEFFTCSTLSPSKTTAAASTNRTVSENICNTHECRVHGAEDGNDPEDGGDPRPQTKQERCFGRQCLRWTLSRGISSKLWLQLTLGGQEV